MGNCPKDVVVPVIFLPGIMGSRLQKKTSKTVVWDPDNTSFMVREYGLNAGSVVGPDLFRLRENANVRSAATKRKAMLIGGATFNKDYLEPMEFSEHDDISNVSTGYWGSQVSRNWGSVSQSSYGPILKVLEGARNMISQMVGQVNPQFNLVEMPVFALGYNWSASNDDSGKYAAEKIREWVSRAKYHAGTIGAQCPGAILLTHSMGGLVARSAAMLHGAAGDIFAVLHTVMPTDGAAAAYKRFHFGFENPDFSVFSPIDGTTESVGYVVLGRQGALVTAILGHMPGGQELLPNKRYKDNSGNPKWLTIHNPERNFIGSWISGDAPYAELPNSNPYVEIYRREDRMYRAANPDWLFPEGMVGLSPSLSSFDYFADANSKAESFHDKLISSGDFHDVTYLCYSADSNLNTYDRIDWKTNKSLGSYGRSINDDNVSTDRTDDYRREHLIWGEEGDKEISGGWIGIDFSIDGASGAGDMTVPSSSGKYATAVPETRRTGHTAGYMHEPALKQPIVQRWVRDTMVDVLGQCSLY